MLYQLLPNGKGVWANNFNHYYVGDVNNNLQSLANYSELGVKFIRHDYTTTFTLNQDIESYTYYHSQLLNNINNVFSVSIYVDVSAHLSSNRDDATCSGMFFVPSDTRDDGKWWNTLYYTSSITTITNNIISCIYFNGNNNIYTRTFDNATGNYQWWNSSTNIFNNPILSLYCTRDGTLNLTANIKYTILAFA